MIGLAVAVDYSLFILMLPRGTRWRRFARGLARAFSTSAVAVTFSGVTVMAALAGLFLMRRRRLRAAGPAAFMPSVIILLGDRAWWLALARWLDRLLPEAGVE